MVIIEAKASGIPLTHELRQMDIPVINFTPSRGNDKHVRVNSIAPLFEAGKIWAPKHEHFAQEVIEECASFPYGDHDDYVDSTTQAIMRVRQGGLVPHPEDYKEEKNCKEQPIEILWLDELLSEKFLNLIKGLGGKSQTNSWERRPTLTF